MTALPSSLPASLPASRLPRSAFRILPAFRAPCSAPSLRPALRTPRPAFSVLSPLRLLLALTASLSALRAAPATELTDLGQNLGYLRVAELADVAATVASVVPENRALVLDLRYATASGDSPAQLAAALAKRSGSAPLFILVAPGTPPALASILEKLPAQTTTLGVKEAVPTPRVVVAQPAEVDRRAHAAGDSGLPLAALISGKVEKERYDEASLVKDFSNGNRDPRPPPPPPVVRPNGNAPAPPADPANPVPNPPVAEKAPMLTDRVLQRAVNLHRALLAIRAR